MLLDNLQLNGTNDRSDLRKNEYFTLSTKDTINGFQNLKISFIRHANLLNCKSL